jgi:hypothetical protein
LVGAHYAHSINEWSTPLYAPGIFWHIVRMKKLGAGQTVRVFVPMPEELRDRFRAKHGKNMAGRIRELVDQDTKPQQKAKSGK